MGFKTSIHPLWHIIRCAFSYLPQLRGCSARTIVPSHIVRPEKAYRVWLRHLANCTPACGAEPWLRAVAELGPGESLGVCLSALLSGAQTVYALDIVRHPAVTAAGTLQLLPGLAQMFRERRLLEKRTYRPLSEGMLSRERLEKNLDRRRLEAIGRAVLHGESGDEFGIELRYLVPWGGHQVENGTLDLVVSYAVMEHVEDPDATYRQISAWLRPGGLLSCAIDYGSHGTALRWNGHWRYPDVVWKGFFFGRRPYLINRLPRSAHIGLMRRHGLEIVSEQLECDDAPPARRPRLAAPFRTLSADDLTARGSFFLCRKL